MMSTPWIPTDDGVRTVAIEILRHGPLSRGEIAERLGLSPGSLTRLSRPLLDGGLVHEVGDRSSGRAGRPRQLLDVDPDSRWFVGLKVRSDGVDAALTNLRGEVVRHADVPITERTPEAVVAVVAEVVRALGDGRTLDGIGVGLGGVVRDRSVVASSPYLGWSGVPLADLVERATGVPTLVDNDVVAFTEYEHWFGAGRDLDRFAVVTLGTGIGYGLLVGGEQILDDDAGTGLVNHWPVEPGGPVCPLGHHGCAFAVLTSSALADRVSRAVGRPVRPDEALDLAADGDPGARRVVDDAGAALGRLLAAVCNTTMARAVVIGGEGVRLAAVARAAVDRAVAADRPVGASTPRLVLASGDDVEWSRGAAVLAIQAFATGRSEEQAVRRRARPDRARPASAR